MNRAASVWETLGIEPTQDQRAIRVAYARQLKLIDVDADPQAFIKLRSAFESAQQQTRWADFETHWETASEAPEPPVAAEPETATVDVSTRAQAAEDNRAEIGAAEAHAQALYRLLYALTAPEGGAVAGDPAALMLEHWRGIVADPRLQGIGHFADAERWLAELIARTIPWSDPLVRPASDYFGWAAAEDTISQSPAVAYVASRVRALDFAGQVVQRGHPLHRAWNELTTPANERSKRGWVSGRKVRELLDTVRSDHPELEAHFDWYRVHLWESEVSHGSWLSDIPIGFIIVGVLMLASMAARIGDPPLGPVPSAMSTPSYEVAAPIPAMPMPRSTATPVIVRIPASPDKMTAEQLSALRNALERAGGGPIRLERMDRGDPPIAEPPTLER